MQSQVSSIFFIPVLAFKIKQANNSEHLVISKVTLQFTLPSTMLVLTAILIELHVSSRTYFAPFSLEASRS